MRRISAWPAGQQGCGLAKAFHKSMLWNKKLCCNGPHQPASHSACATHLHGLQAHSAAQWVSCTAMPCLHARRQSELRDLWQVQAVEVGLLLRVGLQDAEQPSTQQKRSAILRNKIWGRELRA